MNPWPIAPLTDKDLNFVAVKYDFTSFTAAEQAELPSLEGAIDLTLLDFTASVADQTPLIASLFDGLDDVGIISSEIDSSDDVGQTLSDLSNSAAAADATLGDYTGQIGDSAGGGGANTIPIQTVTGPMLATCDGRQGFSPAGACGSYPCKAIVPFSNPSSNNLTIESITLVQATGGPWTVTTDAQSAFPPGRTYHLTITATRAPRTTETAQVHIKIQGVTQPAVFCMDAGLGSSLGGSGGGGGPIRIAQA